MDIELEFGRKIHSLFDNIAHTELGKRGFYMPKEVIEGSLLFIGLNPSYKKFDIPERKFQSFHKQGNYKYFKRFEDISEHCDLLWSHLDMFGLRETSQNKILDILKGKSDGDLLNFLLDHLVITKNILEESNPKCIIVENTLSRKILGKDGPINKLPLLDYKYQFDNHIGTDIVVNEDSKLYGKRLKWHINRVI